MMDNVFSQKKLLMQSEYQKKDLCKMVLENSHVGVFLCDPNGTIQYMNQMFAKMFGINRQTAVGRKVTDYFENSALLQVMETGKPHKGVKFSWKGRDAFIFRTPIKNEGEGNWGIVEVFFRDVSKLKNIMRKMNLLEQKVDFYKQQTKGLPGSKYSFKDIIGNSPTVQKMKKQAEKFSNSAQPILILGETGTGKELLAHAIHSVSYRADELFVCINCAAIPKDLMESELFGYEEGAFTGAKAGGKFGKFEIADKGTIFLDEIGELSKEMQAKLLRVIEHKEIEKIGNSTYIESDFRLITSTNRNLEKLVAKGAFREDLYHRVSILAIKAPPLRNRIEDLPDLMQHFLDTLEDKPTGLEVKLDKNIEDLFRSYYWPGNIRELKNVLSFSLLSLDEGESEISLRHLPKYILKNSMMKSDEPVFKTHSLKQVRNASEKDAILNALRAANYNKSKASKILGISRNEIYNKIRKHGL